jgi:hypothetical protein
LALFLWRGRAWNDLWLQGLCGSAKGFGLSWLEGTFQIITAAGLSCVSIEPALTVC